jgi:hypothetical protein
MYYNAMVIVYVLPGDGAAYKLKILGAKGFIPSETGARPRVPMPRLLRISQVFVIFQEDLHLVNDVTKGCQTYLD